MAEQLSPTAIETFLRSLRSVRRYASTPISDEVVTSILEVGRWTGSGKNTQPWQVVVVRDSATIKELSRLGQFADHLAAAPLVIALVLESAGARLDAGRLAERLMLGAWAHGVGSCIGSLFPDDNETRAKELLGVPLDRDLHTTIAFGYPADDRATRVQTSPNRVSILPSIGRKPLSAFAYFERYGRS